MLLAAGVLLGLTSGGTHAPSVASRTADSNYLVTFSRGTSSANQAAAITGAGATLVSSIAPLSMDTIKVPAGSERAVLAALRANANVAGIALNRSRESEGSIDPAYPDQWNLPQIGWDQIYGSASPRGSSTIAVLDTGVSSAGGDLALGPGWSAFGTDPTSDPNGHGTAVASIAAATAGNGIGVAGVDFANVTILPVQVLDSNGLGLDSDIVQGVVWAADHGAKVILMSFSNPGYSQALQDAISYAWGKGAVVVAATGNGGSTAPTYPAGDAGVMGVAGTDQSDAPWASSNTGADTFIAAPATSIPADARDGSETSITGTSASAAMVAGAAALLFAKDPNATNAIVDGRLAESADAVGTTVQTGNGRLNLARAFADTSTNAVTPQGAPGGGPLVGPYASAAASLTLTPNTGASGTSVTVTSGGGGFDSSRSDIGIYWDGTVGTTNGTLLTTCSTGGGGNISGTCTFTVPVSTAGAHTVVATEKGSVTKSVSATFTVTPGAATKLRFTTTAQTLTAGVTSGAVTVEREDAGGNATTLGGAITVNLSTSSTGGVFRDTGDSTTITSVSIASGASSASFKYRDTVAGSPTITAASTGLTSATQQETVNAAAASKLVFTSSAVSGQASSSATLGPITVQRQDQFNNPTTSGTTTVNLSSNSTGTAIFAATSGGSSISQVAISGGSSTASFFYGDTKAATPTLTAADQAAVLTQATQQETVTPAAASKLVFGQQPTSAPSKAAINPTVTVKVEDTFNNVETSDNSTSVSLAIGTNGGTFAGGTLSGGGATTASSGIASFGSLSINNVGTNYTLVASATSLTGATSGAFNITARPITVTAQTNTKTYDATASAAATPTVTGTLAAGDTANFSETYDTKNVGSGKTLTPSGTVTDGNGGNNYSYTFVASSNGTITARALTVTAAANTKTYDATTGAAATPTITAGVLQGSDTANFSEVYSNKNAGTGKTLTPSGTVSDGNSGNNYSYTFVATANGVINQRALTVTAAANTKTYDATTSSSTAPTITTGALQGSDSANFVQTYDTKNVGTGKTLTPSGTVSDGNSGNNYSYTFVASANGTINARALTVTAAANTKTYDATTSAATAPTITSGALQGSDTANFSETYDTRNVGTGKTLTPSGTVNDGNSGNDYSYTFVASTNGVINARALTVTAAANSKVYDSTTSATATPAITSGLLQGSDTASFSETYDTKNAGTGKTLTPSGTVTDGNGGNNYSYTFVASSNGTITARALTVTAAANTKTYDATTGAAATPTITSGALQGSDAANFSESYANKNAGTGKTLTPSGTVTDGNGGSNYTYTFVATTNGVINQRALTVTAATDTKTYDATTSSSTAPTITSGTLQGTDTANFSETYDTKNVGTGKTLTPSGTVTDGNSGNNYSYTFVSDTTGVISQRSITITADSKTKVYGNSDPALTYTVTSGGLAGTDSFSGGLSRAAGENVGTYAISIGSVAISDGNSGNNYALTYNGANLSISARPITVTPNSGQSKVYGTADPVFAYHASSGSLAFSDTFAGALSRDAGENVGTYAIRQGSLTVSDGNGGANYALTFVSANFSITKRPLTITATGQSKTYGTSLSLGTSAFTTSGNEANSEQVTAVTLTSAGGNDASTTASVGTYSGDIVPSAATGSNGFLASNYAITYANGDLTIAKRALTVTASAQSKTYGTSVSLGTTAFTTNGNEANSEQVTSVTLTSAGGYDASTTAPVGTYSGDIVPSAATGSNGFLASNYAITYVNGDLTITKASFTTISVPQINGTPTVGTALTITNGVYSPTTASRSYQWELCDSGGANCSNISSATSNTYTPVAGDVGSTLRIVETVSRSGYYDGGSTSSAATVVNGNFKTTTAVAIVGPPTVDAQSTITAGSYSPTPTSVAYQWELCDGSGNNCSNISGANANSYTPDASEVGSTLRVVETVSKNGYNDGGSTSASALVVNGPITTNTAVAINGTPTVGTASTLTAGSYSPSPTSSAYQWQRCDSSGANCSDIIGATNTTYTPVAADVGSTLRTVETVSRDGYSDGASTSSASPVVVKGAFATTTAVSVNGTPTVDAASTVTRGSYTPTPVSRSYQWKLCDSAGNNCTTIGGATSSTYTPVPGDVGSTLRVVETVSKAGYNNGSSTSAASPVVAKASFSTTTAVAINGTPTVGTATTVTTGVYSAVPTSSSYQWEQCDSGGANCSDIGGATGSTYTPNSGQIGATLRVVETVSRAGYTDGTSTSGAVTVYGVFAATTSVAIHGTPKVGVPSALTAGTYMPSPAGRSYQWERCNSSGTSCVAISGATYATYTPVAADVAKKLRVVETVTKSLYVSGSFTSAASPLVAKGTFRVDTKVAIFGYPKHGVTSTITQGSYTPTPATRTYKWLRCTGTTVASCSAISGARGKTYKPGSADIGKRLRVVETVSSPGYTTLSITSVASTKVT